MENFTITKDQILELYKYTTAHPDKCLKEWFPEAFETKLEVGRWYKGCENEIVCYCGDNLGYGFIENGDWYHNSGWEFDSKFTEWKLATTEEVEAALIAEAKKRGFKEGVWYRKPTFIEEAKGKMIYSINSGELYFTGSSYTIFKNGVWAEIIPTMTKQEAEEKLKCKIV